MELIGKKALITGGAKRVGRTIALELAKKGVNIVLHYNHSENDAHQTRVAVEAQGVKCILVRADLARPLEVRQMLTALPPVDILVNSASLFFKTPIESVNEADWDRLVDSNLKGPFLLSTEIGKRMGANQGGKIVNIADWSGFRPYKDYSAYCTSKGGLITLTRALARDLAPKVTVNAVAPGPVHMPPDMSETEKEAIAKTTALGRWGKPEDVAHAVNFLLENDFISGTVLVVDGGRSIV